MGRLPRAGLPATARASAHDWTCANGPRNSPCRQEADILCTLSYTRHIKGSRARALKKLTGFGSLDVSLACFNCGSPHPLGSWVLINIYKTVVFRGNQFGKHSCRRCGQ